MYLGFTHSVEKDGQRPLVFAVSNHQILSSESGKFIPSPAKKSKDVSSKFWLKIWRYKQHALWAVSSQIKNFQSMVAGGKLSL